MMRTQDLVARLAGNVQPIERNAVARTLNRALVLALASSRVICDGSDFAERRAEGGITAWNHHRNFLFATQPESFMNRAPQNGLPESAEAKLRALLLAGLDGDARAYHAFLQALGAHLRAFLRKRLYRLPNDIEDIVQEILIAVHNGRHTYLPDQPLTAWTHAIARYKVADYLRHRSRHEALNEPLDDQQNIFAESDEEASQARRDVDKLLAQLPDRHRLPILHVKLQGMSVAETAQLTGLSESAVKVGVHRGLKALAVKIRGSL